MEFKKENYREFELNRFAYDAESPKHQEAPKKKEFKADMEFDLEEADPEGAKLEAERLNQEAQAKEAEAIQAKEKELDSYLEPDANKESSKDSRSIDDLMTQASAKEDVVKKETENKEKPKSFDEMTPGEIIGTFLALINSPVFKEAFKTGDYQTIMDVIDDFSHTRNPQETMDKAKTLFEEKLAQASVNDLISLYKEPRGAESKKLFGEKQPYLIQLRPLIESKLKTELGLSQNATLEMDSTVDNRIKLRTTVDDITYEIKIDGANNRVSKTRIDMVEGVEKKTPPTPIEQAFDGSLANLGIKLSNPDTTPAVENTTASAEPAAEQAVTKAKPEETKAENDKKQTLKKKTKGSEPA